MVSQIKLLPWKGLTVFGGSVLYLYFILTVLTGAPVFDRYYGDFSPLIFSLISASFWTCGLWSFLSSNRSTTVFLFFLWNLTSALVILTGAFLQTSWLTWTVSAVCGLLNPTLMCQTLNAKLAETIKRGSFWNKFIVTWYVLDGVLFAFAAYNYFLANSPSYAATHVGDLALVIANLFNLGWLSYILYRSNQSLARNQVRTVLIGLAIPGLPILFLNLVPRLLWGNPIAMVEMLLPLAAGTPLCFYYAIKQQQWLPIDLHISRWMLIGLISSVIGMVYLQGIVGITYLSRQLLLSDGFLLVLLSLLLAAVAYAPLRKRVGQLTERIIYGSNYDYREIIKQVNEELFSLTGTLQIGELVCDKLLTTLGSERVTFVIRSGDLSRFEPVVSRGQADGLTPPQLEKLALFASLHRSGNWYGEPDLACFCQPILHKQRFQGFLVLGPKISGNLYGRTDLYLLETVAASLGITLENSLLLDQLREQIVQLQQAREEAGLLNQQLSRVRDEEREALAYQLHDGVLQNLIFITRQSNFCAGLLHLTSETNRSVQEQLENLQAVAQASIQELRSICNGLYPIAVDTVGLLAALNWLCVNNSETGEVKISLQITGVEADRHWSNPIERALFLTAQEAVRNSLKHAQAQSVLVHLHQQKSELCLEIRDDGIGMRPGWDYGEFACEGHMGLVGMRMRVERLGGLFELSSESEQGTSVIIRVPLNQPEIPPAGPKLPLIIMDFEPDAKNPLNV